MQLVTFAREDGADRLGVLTSDEVVLDLSAANGGQDLGSMLDLIVAGPAALQDVRKLAATAGEGGENPALVLLRDVVLRAPIPRPVKSVYCVGLNFASHVEQNAAALGEKPIIPKEPLFFSKPVTSVIGPGQPIRHDRRLTAKLDYEVELAIVVGRGGTWIPRDEAWDHIFGFTIVNDVSARDLQFRSSQFLYGKGQDSYCPIGPGITTIDAMPPFDEVTLRLTVNGEVRQEETAAHMIFQPDSVIAELSRGITLEPGDIISLGTPGGCGYQMEPPSFLVPGDVVACEATGIGTLANPVLEVGNG